MSVKDILNKLAEKQMLAGKDDFAFRLIEAADISEKCHFCDKKAQIMKRKGKKDVPVCKECSKSTKCDLKGCNAEMMYGEMLKRGEKTYCCSDCAKKDERVKKAAIDEMIEKYAAKKTLTLADAKLELSPYDISITKSEGEYRVNFKGGKEETAYYTDDLGDAIGTGKQMAKSKEKKASASDKGSYKAAIKEIDGFTGMFGDAFCFLKKTQAEQAIKIAESAANFLNWKIERHDDGFMLIPRGFDQKEKTSFVNAGDLLKKYAQGNDFMEESAEVSPDQLNDLGSEESENKSEELDNLTEVMIEGFDAAMADNDQCPYSTNTDEWFAWQAGWKSAVSGKTQDAPDAKYYSFETDSEGDSDLSSLLNKDDDEFISDLRQKLLGYNKD